MYFSALEARWFSVCSYVQWVTSLFKTLFDRFCHLALLSVRNISSDYYILVVHQICYNFACRSFSFWCVLKKLLHSPGSFPFISSADTTSPKNSMSDAFFDIINSFWQSVVSSSLKVREIWSKYCLSIDLWKKFRDEVQNGLYTGCVEFFALQDKPYHIFLFFYFFLLCFKFHFSSLYVTDRFFLFGWPVSYFPSRGRR